MAWTEITRRRHERDDLRHVSDVRDEEWALISPYLPKPKRFGRPRTTDLRAVADALPYMLMTGCQWRMLPTDFPPYSTVQRFFYRWRADSLWDQINHQLVMRAREIEGRDAGPTAGIIDNQSAKTTEAGGPRGYDAGKKIKGRKRHIPTDRTGMLTAAIVHEVAEALAITGRRTLEIVKRSDTPTASNSCQRRWVVERTLAWLNHNHRLAKDFEATIESAKAWLMTARVKLIIRRLAKQ